MDEELYLENNLYPWLDDPSYEEESIFDDYGEDDFDSQYTDEEDY